MTARGDENIARTVADVHERFAISNVKDDPTYGQDSEAMDRYNNETGIKFGLESDGDFATVIRKCVGAAREARKLPRSELGGLDDTTDGSLIFFRGD